MRPAVDDLRPARDHPTARAQNWKAARIRQDRAGLLSWARSLVSQADKRKQTLYFPEDMLKEIQHEAQRLDRSLSWIVQQCWKISRSKLKEFPSSTEEPGSLPDPREE